MPSLFRWFSSSATSQAQAQAQAQPHAQHLKETRAKGHQPTDEPGREAVNARAQTPGVAKLSHAEESQTLVHRIGTGVLSTLHHVTGHPFGSLVNFAVDPKSGDVVFLVSQLAEHTENLSKDKRASIFVQMEAPPASSSPEEPRDALAFARVTLVGSVTMTAKDPEMVALIEAKHPATKHYSSFSDFSLARFKVESARYISGFGSMSWVQAKDYATAQPDSILNGGADTAFAIKHMNEDHGEDICMLLETMCGTGKVTNGRVTRMDELGMNLAAVSVDTGKPVTGRVAFDHRLTGGPRELRGAVVALCKKAKGE